MIDGRNIQTKEEYLKIISIEFKFPIYPNLTWDGYLDWIQDLEWLKSEGYILIIKNFKSLCNKERGVKELIINQFENAILPYWEDEVVHCVVGGKAKSFNVYLID